jgi:hypothetical protein
VVRHGMPQARVSWETSAGGRRVRRAQPEYAGEVDGDMAWWLVQAPGASVAPGVTYACQYDMFR